jgi:hypothetical protein
MTDEIIEPRAQKKNELKYAADIKFLEWWFSRNSKKSEKIYEEYQDLVRKANAARN